MWEAAPHTPACPPPVPAAQLDRLTSAMGPDAVELGVVPLAAALKICPGNGFRIHDERRVVIGDWHTEPWPDDTDTVATYLRVWNTLRESAVYGAEAHDVITAARHAPIRGRPG